MPNVVVVAAHPDGSSFTLALAQEVARAFPEAFSTYIAANVMPQIGKLQVEPAREVIRKVFMEKIIYAKGLNKASRLIDGIFMPTPAALMAASPE